MARQAAVDPFIPTIGLAPHELIVDSFAGGGGASQGILEALGRSPDIAINHDAEAIALHTANHGQSRHYRENVWLVDPQEATGGRPVGLMWLSPDCRHFSRARGGKPASKRVRGLAWVAVRWAAAVRPRVIALENVIEFTSWGGVLADGHVDKKSAGKTFRAFVRKLERLGYVVAHNALKACDFGAPTIRNRFFLIARCDGQAIVWPTPTHGPNRPMPWRAAAECIDWSLPCPSIFTRKKPLAVKTMARIGRGVQRFVVDAEHPYLAPAGVNTTTERTRRGRRTAQLGLEFGGPAIVDACTRNVVVSTHITKFRSGARDADMTEPTPTESANSFLTALGGEEPRGVVAATLIQTGYGERKGQAPRVPGLAKPLGTIVAGGVKHAVVTCHLLKLHGSAKDGRSFDLPLPTIRAQGMHLAEVRCFFSRYYGGDGTATLKPIVIDGEEYVLSDIGLRMLSPRELYRAQGFPDSYVIDIPYRNPKTGRTGPLPLKAQIRMVGNSVCPPMARAVVSANFGEVRAAGLTVAA